MAEHSKREWQCWFQQLSTADQDALTKNAEYADRSWEGFSHEIPLAHTEQQLREKITSSQQLSEYTKDLERQVQTHKSRKRHTAESYVQNFLQLVEQYVPLVDALSELAPYGAGKAVWGAFSILITVVVNKGRLEAQFDTVLNRLRAWLPRVEAYRSLYPTTRMYECIACLHAEVAKFVADTVRYYKDLSWIGGFKRLVKSSTNYQERVNDVLTRIEKASKDVTEEGTVEMSVELRETRQIAEAISRKNDDLARQVDRMGMENSRDKLRQLRIKLVPDDYDHHGLLESARKRQGSRSTTEEQAGKHTLDSDVRPWLKSQKPDEVQHESFGIVDKKSRLMFLHSSRRGDPAVSHVTLQIVGEAEDHFEVVLHSVQHSTLLNVGTTDNTISKRSPRTIFREAIYQLLVQRPSLLQQQEVYEHVNRLETQFALSEIVTCLKTVMVGAYQNASNTQLPSILWVIDRIDDCHLGGQERLQIFIKELQRLIVGYPGSLSVLVVSSYEPSSLDKYWDEDKVWRVDEDDDCRELQELKSTWRQVEYCVRRRYT